MTKILASAREAAMIAAALVVAGCGGGDETANTADVNTLDANMLLEQPANDASAIESAFDASEPAASTNGGEKAETNQVRGETKGGDTGGNSLDRNITGA